MKRVTKSFSAFLFALLMGLLCGQVMGQTKEVAAGAKQQEITPRAYEDLLRSVEKDLGKIRLARNKPDILEKLTSQLEATERNKEVALKFRVTDIEPRKTEQGNFMRIFSRTEKIRKDGINLNFFIYAFVPEKEFKSLGKLKSGDEIIAQGILSKSNFTVDSLYRLNMDLRVTKVIRAD